MCSVVSLRNCKFNPAISWVKLVKAVYDWLKSDEFSLKFGECSLKFGEFSLTTLLTFSLLISDDFCVFLACLGDRSLFIPSDKCAENTVIARKREENSEILTNW